MDGYNSSSNSEKNFIRVSLTFPLDINFIAGDMIGFSHMSGIRPLEVHRASASNHSYLQWSSVSTLRNVLTTEDATTMTPILPILNVEGNHTHVMPTYALCFICVSAQHLHHPPFCDCMGCQIWQMFLISITCCMDSIYIVSHASMEPPIICTQIQYLRLPHISLVPATCHPCPSISQTTLVSKLMSGSLSDVATTSDGPNSAITMDTSSGGITAYPNDTCNEGVMCFSEYFLPVAI